MFLWWLRLFPWFRTTAPSVLCSPLSLPMTWTGLLKKRYFYCHFCTYLLFFVFLFHVFCSTASCLRWGGWGYFTADRSTAYSTPLYLYSAKRLRKVFCLWFHCASRRLCCYCGQSSLHEAAVGQENKFKIKKKDELVSTCMELELKEIK